MDARHNAGNPTIAVGRQVMNAVRKLQGRDGITLRDLKKFLKDAKKMDVVANDSDIKFSLKKALDRGILTRNDGNYKMIEAKRRRSKKRSAGAKTSRKRRSSPKRGKRKSSKRKSSGKRRRRRKSPAKEA